MKLTASTLLTGLFISISSLVYSQTVNINEAKEVAQNHLLSVGRNHLKSASLNRHKYQFSSLSVTSESKDTLYFVLNDTINHSFVIVAGDKRSSPIIGYSLEGNYDLNNQPPAFVAWMESRKQEIASIKQNNLQADSTISQQWNNLSSTNSKNTETTNFVEPLLKTKWNQGCYYNSMCPSVLTTNFSCGHMPTGCVATSMAQIMKYWNYPTTGTGSHSYLSAGNGILSADFGSTTYQWNQMPNEVTSSNDAVATLMYHCGVALDMRYDTNGSGAFDPRDELVKYFKYSSFAEYVDKRSYLPGDWVNLLKSELNDGRPIWYNGSNNPCGGGHAFICDGYQDSDYFHFNWGWGGSFDGYFYLESLNPGLDSYTIYQAAIIKIFPTNLPEGYKGIMLSTKKVGIGINGGTADVEISSSTEWTASSDQKWLTLNTANGTTGSNTITFSAMANPSTEIRKATVTISAPGLVSQTIAVTQYSIIEATAGNLKTNLGSQLSTITSLTLKGTIDASDFRTMRDEMPALIEIDLSGTTIASYTGTEGTIGDANYSYPVNTIPNFAFLYPMSNRAKSRLQSIKLPLTITSINDYAFQGCKNLTIENIPSSVTFIGDGAFLECNFLNSIVIPASVTSIGSGAFSNFNGSINIDPNNPNYSSLDGVLFNKTQTNLIQCPVSKFGNYTIPTSVRSIGNLAFYGCSDLTTVTIPTSVTTIGGYAFNYCDGLESISIPSSVTIIEEGVFSGFKGSITVDANNPKYSTLEGVLFNKNQTELIQCPVSIAGTYAIPSTVTTVLSNAFHACVNISSMIIPGSVKNIGIMAFNLVGLSSIYAYPIPPVNLNSSANTFAEINKSICILYIPYGTKALYEAANEWQAFGNMVEMPGLFLSDKTVNIGKDSGTALINISSNESWTINSNQTWLTMNPVAGTSGISEITFTFTANSSFSSRKATVTVLATGLAPQTIEVTQNGKVEATAGNLKTILGNQLSTITSLNLTGTIDARDFKTMRDNMPALTEINLSDVRIVEYTGTEGPILYYGNISLYYPANSIPSDAFFNSSIGKSKITLKSFVFPSSITSIGSNAFGRMTGLNNFSIPSTITSIGYQAFVYFKNSINVDANNLQYSSLDGILFNKDQTELIQCPVSKTGDYTIPASVKTIDENAFGECTGLTRVIIPSSVTSLKEGIFSNCSNLTSINIPISITSIGRNAFIYCHKLTSITIPSSIISIEDYAFGGCDQLNSIYASSMSPVDLNHSPNVFNSINKSSCILYVPHGSKAAYQTASQWKDFTNIVEINLPVAIAGTDQTMDENTLITLDGSASSDPDNSLLTYLWMAPEGIVLSSNSAARPTFKAPEVTSDTILTFSLTVTNDRMCSTAGQIVISVINVDKAPYVKNPIKDISVNKTAPDQIIDLQTVFADYDLADILSYNVTSNINEQVVTAKITGGSLTLSFSSENNGSSEITIAATSNGKEVITKFNVEVKIPTGIVSFSDKKFKLYPNPTNGKIKLEFDLVPLSGIELTVTDLKGKTILKKLIRQNQEWIDLTGNKPGLYLLKTNGDNAKVQKVVLK